MIPLRPYLEIIYLHNPFIKQSIKIYSLQHIFIFIILGLDFLFDSKWNFNLAECLQLTDIPGVLPKLCKSVGLQNAKESLKGMVKGLPLLETGPGFTYIISMHPFLICWVTIDLLMVPAQSRISSVKKRDVLASPQ